MKVYLHHGLTGPSPSGQHTDQKKQTTPSLKTEKKKPNTHTYINVSKREIKSIADITRKVIAAQSFVLAAIAEIVMLTLTTAYAYSFL